MFGNHLLTERRPGVSGLEIHSLFVGFSPVRQLPRVVQKCRVRSTDSSCPVTPPLPWKDTSLSLTVFMLFSQASILWFKLIFFFGTFVANCCVSSDTLETRRWNWNHQWRCHLSCHSPWLCFCRSRLNWGFLEESDLTFWFSALYCGR